MEGYENHKWFEITDEAKNQMEKLLNKNPDKYAVSLIVEGGGCAGFKYKWGFIDKKEQVSLDQKIQNVNQRSLDISYSLVESLKETL